MSVRESVDHCDEGDGNEALEQPGPRRLSARSLQMYWGLDASTRDARADGRGTGGWWWSRCRSVVTNGRLLSSAAILGVSFGVALLAYRAGLQAGNQSSAGEGAAAPNAVVVKRPLVTKIAFGSCTSKAVQDQASQPIWTSGVVPAEPDVFIWLGDIAYLDYPSVDCEAFPNVTQCNCAHEDDFFKIQPFCLAGDLDHSLDKYRTQLRNADYNAFLDYMCPGAKSLGLFPPPGMDPAICTRSIMGLWDDHDYGWSDGDGRLPNKWEFKNMYLDAIGESPLSPRRNQHKGMWHRYRLNEDYKGREVDIFLLDGRYDRDVKPCYTRAQWCQVVVLATDGHSHTGFCKDFLHGGVDGLGSCCLEDEQIQFGWCLQEGNRANDLWTEACDWTSPLYGRRAMVLDQKTGDLRFPDGSETKDAMEGSPFCEMLGREQRLWFQEEMMSSIAPVRLIASGSVLVGNPGNHTHNCEGLACVCGGDDWDCYRGAQRNIMSVLGRAPGCNIVLAGDYHWGDLKVMKPGRNSAYSDWYGSDGLEYPLYQIMSSGLTLSTAEPFPCTDFRLDPAGLRVPSECDFVNEPNFGIVELFFGEEDASGTAPIDKIVLSVRDTNNIIKLSQTIVPSEMCQPALPR